ncbi:MAG: DMT family transporter [Flavobacteriales bacterium]
MNRFNTSSKFNLHLLMHFVVILFGFTGIFGALTDIDSVQLVWYRMSLAAIGVFLASIWIKDEKGGITNSIRSQLLGIGIIVAAHWIAFFEAIEQSNVSITLICLSSASFFTALLEPLFHNKKIKFYELILGTLVIGGVWMIYKVESIYKIGIILSIIAAILASLFTVLNSLLLNKVSSLTITKYEMIGGVVTITLYLLLSNKTWVNPIEIPMDQVIYILLLGLLCTAFAFIASIYVMKELSPFTVALTINMEPVYGIILALLILGDEEKMSAGFYLGGIIIILAVISDAIIKKKTKG